MAEIVKTLSFDETEIKFTGDGKQGIFEGYASVFNNTDSDGDIILPGAFKNALTSQSRKVAMFFNHKTWELPVGKWDSLAEDDKGLYVRGQLTPTSKLRCSTALLRVCPLDFQSTKTITQSAPADASSKISQRYVKSACAPSRPMSLQA